MSGGSTKHQPVLLLSALAPGTEWQTLETAACQMACSQACHVTTEGLRVPSMSQGGWSVCC